MKILNFIKKYFSDNEKVLYLGSTDKKKKVLLCYLIRETCLQEIS